MQQNSRQDYKLSSDPFRQPSKCLIGLPVSLLLYLLSIFMLTDVLAAPQVRDELWVANGPVYAMAANDDASHLFNNGVFSYTAPGSGAIAMDARFAQFDKNFPHINGPVYALASDGAGGWYIGGKFSQVGGSPRGNLAYISWNGSTWKVEAWNPAVDNAVYTLALSADGSTLFAGGAFTTVVAGTLPRNHLAAFDVADGSVDTGWDPDVNGVVRTMVVVDSTLYVGGDFTRSEGLLVTRNHVAAIDIDNITPSPDYGKTTDWNPNANGAVYTLSVSGGRMYMGGDFTQLNGGGVTRNYAAIVDSANAEVDTAWDPSPNGRVRAIAHSLVDSRVYLGGDFTTINSLAVSQSYLAAVDNTNGVVISAWEPGVNARVYSLLPSPDGLLYAGGDFTLVDGEQRNRLAAFDQVTGELDGDWTPDAWDSVNILAGFDTMVTAGGGFDRDSRALLYIGGSFDYVGPVTGSVVKLDATAVADSTLPRVDGTVYTTVADGSGGWYIGGDFTTVGGVARNNLAHIDASGSLDPLWDGDANGIVRALAVSGTTVYAGGDFTTVNGGVARNHLVALSTADGTVLGAWDGDADGIVRALAVSGTTVFAGGDFTAVNGVVTRNYLAALDSSNGSVLGSWDGDANGVVHALAVSNDGLTLFAGGDFTAVNGVVTRNYLAALDSSNGSVLGSWDGDANGVVRALAVSIDGLTLFAGGDFTLLGDISRNRVAAVTTVDGSVENWNPSAGGSVYSLSVYASDVFAGGSFASVGGVTRHNLAAVDLVTGEASDWNPGVDGEVRTLLLSGTDIYVGGSFTAAGGKNRNNLARVDKLSGVAAAWNPDADGPVLRIHSSGNNFTVLVAGGFNSINTLERHGLAEISTDNGVPISWYAAFDTGAEVRDLYLSGTVLYVGGDFTLTDASMNPVATNLAALNRASGSALGWRPSVDGIVNTLLLSPDASRIYIGGDFTTVDSQGRWHLAALDPQASEQGSYVQSWQADTGSVGDTIRSLALSRDRTTLYIGGEFNLIGGVSRARLAAARVVDASIIDDGSWTVTADAPVNRLLLSDDVLFAGGMFTTVNQSPRPGLAALDALPVETDPPVTQASPPGGSYNEQGNTPVELSCDDGQGSGCAATYYAMDGGAWQLYTSPLILKQDTQLQFFSIDNIGNSEDRTLNQEDYILEVTPPQTTISPQTGVYQTETLTLTLSCTDDKSGCAATYYTLDNSTPTQASTLYTGPFRIHGAVVVKYFSVDQVGNEEIVRRASYVSSFGGSGVWDAQLLLLLLLPALWRQRGLIISAAAGSDQHDD